MSDLNTSCILWDKWIDKGGYGKYTIITNGNSKTYRAHRYFYEEKFGKIENGKVIDHLCRNRSCINLDHLEVVTQAENVRRGKSTKLDIEAIKRIKEDYKSKKLNQSELALKYKVHQGHISRVLHGFRWT